jgi:two-component system response regulator ArlR
MSTRLLIIDDDVDLSDGLADLLRDVGYVVETANDAHRGLSLLEANGYDVVLLDIKLPGMTGIQFLERLRARPPKGRIFIMSGAPDAAERLAAGGLTHMAAGVIQKPFDVEDLLRRIRGEG